MMNIKNENNNSEDKMVVYTTYDPRYGTWNALDLANNCLFSGTIDQLEGWLDKNKASYQEIIH
jgi:hypothetical protein